MYKPQGIIRIGQSAFFALFVLTFGTIAQAAPFTPGNVVIYRVGDGSAALGSAATAVFLDEYTTSGTPVQSVAMPTTASGAQKQLVASGTATSEGFLNTSNDGQYLMVPGYAAATGTAGVGSSASSSVSRTIGRVKYDGTIDTSTALNNVESGNNFRAACSTDGTNIWLSGAADGVDYATFGSTTGTKVGGTTNSIDVLVFNSQLYESSQKNSILVASVGTGEPTTSGQTVTNLTGLPTGNTHSYALFFASLSAGTVLYVADDTDGTATGEILKYSLVSGTWTANGTINAAGVRGLTGVVSGSTVNLYATAAGTLYSFSDSTGYNAAVSGSVSSLATAATNEAFRGIALAPAAPPTPTPTLTATNTAVPTATNTATQTPIPTDTPTDTPTQVPPPTDTSTPVPTATQTPTITNTPTQTPTGTNQPTQTPTETETPTNTPTATPTATETATPTATNTDTPTQTPTNTDTPTETPTNTETPTQTPTNTNTTTPTATPTNTPTFSPTPTATPAPFTAGNIVVYRVGDGVSSLVSSGNAVFLDEYTSGGMLVQSIELPPTAGGSNYPLIASGSAASEGLLTRSTDGQYLLLTGYARNLGGSGSLPNSHSATVPRTVGRVAFDGSIDTSTALGDFADANNPRSAVSTDGMTLWVGGAAGGVRYTTPSSTTSTQLSTDSVNIEQVNIFGGQLYASSQKGSIRVANVGAGTPTTAGQSITNLPGFPTSGNPDAFFFADLDGSPGLDTLYVADDTAGQIQKYSLGGGNWTASGTITAANAHGVTGVVSGTTVTLYASGTTGTDGTLYTFTDTTGYNGTISGTASTLVTAPVSEAFRGVALAPVQATATPTPTNTEVPTDTATPVPTDTATPVPTDTATPAPTDTPTQAPAATATSTATQVPTATNTTTPAPTATYSATPVPTATNTATPVATATSTATQAPTATYTATPVPTATNSATTTPTVTGTATPTATTTPEDSGFIPPDKNTGKCEDAVAKHLKALAACVTTCQIKQADSALKGMTFDEEACEEGTGKPASCRAKYDKKTTALTTLKKPICPPCLDATAQGSVADTLMSFLETNNGLIYCAGTVAFGGDDSGFVPPDKNTGKCEDAVAKHLKSLQACDTHCQVKQADKAFKGTPFDEDGCEEGTGKPASCRAKYDKASTALLGMTTQICPPCLGATAQGSVADAVTNFVDQINGHIYCAGTVPLPTP
jgi:hypothetical protein